MAFYLTKNSSSSQSNSNSDIKTLPHVSIGTYNQAYASEDLKYVKTISNRSWSITLTSFSFSSLKMSGSSSAKSAIIDPSSSLIILSETLYRDFEYRLDQDFKIGPNSAELIEFKCSDSELQRLPDLIFALDGKEFSLSHKYYVFRNDNEKLCVFLITQWKKDVVVLGDPFMKAYYTVFNAEKFEIGIARSWDNQPPEKPNSGLSTTVWIIVGAAAVVFVSIVLGILCYLRKREELLEILVEPLQPVYN